jgi:hypothetical protein
MADGVISRVGPHRIFLIPELLLAVLEHFEPNNRHLCAVCLVNTKWAQLGLERLWSTASDRKLIRVSFLTTPERCKFYASLVVRLDVFGSVRFVAQQDFRRLKHASFWFQPNKGAELHHAVVQRWLLPRWLTSLTFCPPYNPFCRPGALVFYAQLGALQNLSFSAVGQPDYYPVTITMVQQVVDHVRDPFPQLRLLDVCLDTAALRLLAAVFVCRSHFTSLHLTISAWRGCDAVFPTLAQLLTLESLRVQMLPPMVLDTDDLLRLRRLCALRTLELSGAQLDAPRFGDRDLALLLADLWQLRRLHLWMRSDVSVAALPMIGISLPQLQHLEMPVQFRLRALDDYDAAAPLFPLLRKAILHIFEELRPHIPVQDPDEDELA